MIVVAGSLNMDLVGRVPRLPTWGETVLGEAFARFAGGKGGNQAVAAARLGAPVVFAGAVGDDPFGAELRSGLQAEGIDVSDVQTVGTPTGCALIHVRADGDNAISVLPGANGQAPLPPARWPAAWRCLLLQLEIPMATNVAWAQAGRAAGATVMLNAAPMAPLPPALLSALDLLLVNEVELLGLVGRQPSVAAGLQHAARLGPPRVVATLGPRGCVAWDAGRLIQHAGFGAAVVDTTGAGDTFAGALAACLWQRLSFDEALRRANAAAAISCTRPGARDGMPHHDELDAWLESCPLENHT